MMNTCFVHIADFASAGLEAFEELDVRDRARALRFHREDDRQRFAVGRYLARRLAGHVAGVDPATVSIGLRCAHCGSADHGQPRAHCPVGVVPLSISHSGQKVLVAATEGVDVGADIEQLDPARFDPGLFAQMESPTEAGRTPRDAWAFTRLWTLKEAALKCRGEGLMVSPRSFTIDLSGGAPRLLGGSGRLAPPMTLRTIDAGDGYMAALALAVAGGVRVVPMR